jgi:alpha-tubulin suppressor-like RCC1 family protein
MPTTNFKNSSGTDIGNTLVEKSYLIDRYPELADTFRQSGLWMWGVQFIGIDPTDPIGYGPPGSPIPRKSSPVSALGANINWKLIATSTNYYSSSHAGIKNDGTLWQWGGNIRDGATSGRIDDVIANKFTPVQMGSATNWKLVATGRYYMMGIKTDGTLWGQGSQGASFGVACGLLGTGSGAVTYTSPVQTISGGTNWKDISCGEYHTMALKTDGTLWLWGSNNNGRLGINSFIGDNDAANNRSSPVQTIAGGTNWKQISAGGGHSTAIKTDGTLWTWGRGSEGQLGDGTSGQKSSPVQVPGTTWKFVNAGHYSTFGIKTDGTLWGWGTNYAGMLGDGTTTDRSSPVQTIAGGTNWKTVSCSYFNASAIKTDGTLWCWGYNADVNVYGSWGVVGDNTQVHKSSPVQTAAGGSNWKMVSTGGKTVLAIRDDSADIFGNSL